MKSTISTLGTVVLLLLVSVASAQAEVALEPDVVTGPPCPAGSAVTNSTITHFDTDGNGHYDYFVKTYCNGKTNEGDWPSTTSVDEIPLGQVPITGSPTYVDIDITGTRPNGAYTFVINYRRVDNNDVVAYVEFDINGDLSFHIVGSGSSPGSGIELSHND